MEKTEAFRCPLCNSDNIRKSNQPKHLAFISILFLGFPFPFLKKSYFCFDCRNEWKKEK